MKRFSKIINLTFLSLTIFFLADWFLYATFKISLRGFWSDRILGWLWFLAFVVWMIYWIKTVRIKLWQKIVVVIASILLSIMILGPFIFFATVSQLKLRKDFGKYSLEINQTALGGRRLEVTENYGIFEKELPKGNYMQGIPIETDVQDVKLVSEDEKIIYFKIKDFQEKWHDVKFPKKIEK